MIDDDRNEYIYMKGRAYKEIKVLVLGDVADDLLHKIFPNYGKQVNFKDTLKVKTPDGMTKMIRLNILSIEALEEQHFTA